MKGAHKNLSFNGKSYCMKHLAPLTFMAEIANIPDPVQITINYSNHVFSDQKGNGPEIPPDRFFCADRYAASLNLPQMLSTNLLTSYVVPHINKGNNEMYHYMEVNDYAIFFALRKDNGHPNGLKLYVVSAYEVNQWGRHSIPKSRPMKFAYVAHLRLNGQTVYTSRKAKRR